MLSLILFPIFSLWLVPPLLGTGLPCEVDPPAEPCAGGMIIHGG